MRAGSGSPKHITELVRGFFPLSPLPVLKGNFHPQQSEANVLRISSFAEQSTRQGGEGTQGLEQQRRCEMPRGSSPHALAQLGTAPALQTAPSVLSSGRAHRALSEMLAGDAGHGHELTNPGPSVARRGAGKLWRLGESRYTSKALESFSDTYSSFRFWANPAHHYQQLLSRQGLGSSVSDAASITRTSSGGWLQLHRS